MGTLMNILKSSAKRRNYKEQLEKALRENARLKLSIFKIKQALESSGEPKA